MHALFAVHLSDGLLTWPWWVGGYVVGALVLWVACRGIDDRAMTRVGMLSAAAFVTTSVLHIPIPPTSVHLLLTGLLGVMLGRHAPLSIAIVLGLQALMLGHGGFTTLGINLCVQSIPAWMVFGIHSAMKRCIGSGITVRVLTFLTVGCWCATAIITVEVLIGLWRGTYLSLWAVDPSSLMVRRWGFPLVVAGFSLLVTWRIHSTTRGAEFAIGTAIGCLGVMMTAGAVGLVLALSGEQGWDAVAVLVLAAHLPAALLEGVILGMILEYMASADPTSPRKP